MDVSWAFRLLQLQGYTLNFTEMILYFNLTKLRLMNFYQVMTNVQLFLSQEDLETLKLKDAAKVFDEKYKAFDAAVQPMRGDVDTKELNKLDERRDKALMGLYGHVRVFTGFPEEAKATAAQQLQAILLKYDKAPQTKPLREETAIVSNVVSDLEVADAKAKLTLIGADKWLDELKDANKKFEAAYNARTQRNMDLVGQTKEKRIALDGEYRRLAHTINALATLGGEAPYKRLMSSINADIQQALLAERPETKKKEPKDPKEPKQPKEPKEPKTPKDPKEPKQPDTPKNPKDPKKPEQPGGEQPKKPDEKPKPGGDGNPDIKLPEE
jgi:ORF34